MPNQTCLSEEGRATMRRALKEFGNTVMEASTRLGDVSAIDACRSIVVSAGLDASACVFMLEQFLSDKDRKHAKRVVDLQGGC